MSPTTGTAAATRMDASSDTREAIALGIASLLVAGGLTLVPSWLDALADPCRHAAVAGALMIPLLILTRRLGPRGLASERLALAVFLAGMPLIYLARWFTTGGGAGRGWLLVELAGGAIFITLAALGLRRSPWFLAVGIAGHGLLWDAWHGGSPHIPAWYALDCLLVDVGLGAYLALRIRTWARWERGD